jgi:hypothetical protein
VRTLAFDLAPDTKAATALVTVAGKKVNCSCTRDGARIRIALSAEAIVEAGQEIHVEVY